jgi:DNA/RNA endonuclease G (NUC1)
MKRFFYLLVIAALAVAALPNQASNAARSGAREPMRPAFVSQTIVISQVFGGGGSAGAPYTHDFVEIFNRSASPVNLGSWSVQYASASGSNWLPASPLPNFILQPGRYFLIQFASNGANGSPLPAPDFIAPVIQPEGFIPNLSGTTGKLALVNTAGRLAASVCPTDPAIVDFVGYGASPTCFEGPGPAPAISVTTALKRNADGCSDLDRNNTDFAVVAPAPRNSASTANTCNLGGILQAGITANPNTVTPPGNTLIAVSVIPATTPPSTGLTVVGNLSDIGGPISQPFFDDGTNGDVTPGDNVYSFMATVPAGVSGGSRTASAVVSDAEGRSIQVFQNLTINAPLAGDDPLILGNPTNATSNIAEENNYLMPKPQYTLSYNRGKATANWVAWRLDSSWIGSAPRQDDYRPDPALPAGWYQVQDNDYSGSGYDRGHMCPSGDRTRSVPDNSATFLMTNFIPQLAANNQGPWEDFEVYCRTLANQGNEIYIFSGPYGNIGTVGSTQQNRITVPSHTWKVVLVLPNGTNDLERASSKRTRAFGVIMSNQSISQSAPWRNFRVTVDQVELLTGFDFFSAIPKNSQALIERRRDIL